jgi:hypothetical protein
MEKYGQSSEAGQLEIVSDPETIENFIAGSLHQDFLNELKIRQDQITELLDDPSLKFSGRQYDMFRGAKQNLKYVEALFIDMLANKKHDLGLEEEVGHV